LNVPLLIIHAEDDWDIPHSHSQTLFDAFLEHHLPVLPGITGIEAAEEVVKLSEARKALRQELVMSSEVPRVGRVEVFSKDRLHNKVVYLRTRWGGHDRVGLVEGVQDYIADMFKLGQ
jgi:abhydrolase domain-containing protein 12